MPLNLIRISFLVSLCTLCFGNGLNFGSPVVCGEKNQGYEVINNRCYKFHTHGVLWLQANRTCASEDAYLAVPNDAEEVKVLVDLFARYPPSVITGCEWKERVAIGVYRDSEDVWRTCDGGTVPENAIWEPSQPSGTYRYRYGAFSRYGKLENFDGNLERAFICEKSPVMPPPPFS